MATLNPVYLSGSIYYIDSSEIAITNISIFARRTDCFQIAMHKGTYNGHPVAIKVYEAISAEANFEEIEKEISLPIPRAPAYL